MKIKSPTGRNRIVRVTEEETFHRKIEVIDSLISCAVWSAKTPDGQCYPNKTTVTQEGEINVQFIYESPCTPQTAKTIARLILEEAQADAGGELSFNYTVKRDPRS